MKMLTMAAVVITAAVIFLREWPRVGKEKAKERATFLMLLGLGVLLAFFLWRFPRMPGPTDLVEAMFHSMAAALGL
ncbi:MAG: hypothetical protein C6W55_08605 [Thermobacillus sp.]|uniref:Uncharacterized protein n=1 Tax=Thermobacillus composti (strain DSM 18247 / JCM 13945 / KWC4) TaxID=717605 RepID=L0EA07_THECK|nr:MULTISPECIES: hypothetical protein [Thermobacillus]AGA56617.1 hypothetical protein Theco_0396 [Thermobacillus composti KWC4]REK55953.1 MAG: hypothetical protein C6W55_08605 [Thermobacillus sp.]